MKSKFIEYFSGVCLEAERADRLHGDWQGDAFPEMLERIESELDEVQLAFKRGDLHGVHGVLKELQQVGVTVFKMHREIDRAAQA